MRRQCFVHGALPSPYGKCTTKLAVCAISSLQFMNRAFSPASKSPSFCGLCAKASAISFPFHSACRLRTGCQANKILTNDASHCFGIAACPCWWLGWLSDLVGLPCVSHAGHGRGCLRAARFLPHSEGWHWMAKYSRTKVHDYGNAGLRVRGILLVCFSELIFCLPLCKVSKAVWLNAWVFLFVFSLRWFSFPRAIFSFNK